MQSGEDQVAGSALMAQTLEQKKSAWKRQFDRTPSTYLRELTLNVLLHPTRDEMATLLNRWPAFPDRLCQTLREHGGGTVEIAVKKE
jgi:hypothetical protein